MTRYKQLFPHIGKINYDDFHNNLFVGIFYHKYKKFASTIEPPFHKACSMLDDNPLVQYTEAPRVGEE